MSTKSFSWNKSKQSQAQDKLAKEVAEAEAAVAALEQRVAGLQSQLAAAAITVSPDTAGKRRELALSKLRAAAHSITGNRKGETLRRLHANFRAARLALEKMRHVAMYWSASLPGMYLSRMKARARAPLATCH